MNSGPLPEEQACTRTNKKQHSGKQTLNKSHGYSWYHKTDPW